MTTTHAVRPTTATDEPVEMFVRRIVSKDAASLIEHEWLVTNGLGGYASGTIAGAATRRYHGLLIAAHPAPLGRIILLSHISEQFRVPDQSTFTVGVIEQAQQPLEVERLSVLKEFRLEMGLPVWTYEIGGQVVE